MSDFHWSWWIFSWPWHSKQCISFPFSPKQSVLNTSVKRVDFLAQQCLNLGGRLNFKHLRVSWFQKMGSICIMNDNSGQAQESWGDMVLLIKVILRNPVRGGIRSFREAEILFCFYFWCLEAFWVAFTYYSFENVMVFLDYKKTLWLFCCGFQVPKVCAMPRVSEQVFLFQPTLSNANHPFTSHFWKC